MDSIKVTKILTIILFFCVSFYIRESDGTEADRSGGTEVLKDANADKVDKNVKITELSVGHFAEAVELIKKSKLYEKLQEVLVHYVSHFLTYDKMTMLTKSGRITVPLSDKIQRNLSSMVKHIIHVEHTFTATKEEGFDFTDPVNKFRFIRNNTEVLDKIIEHANASFRAHKEIENPEKIKFYNTLKQEGRFFKTEHLYESMNNLIEIQIAASPSLSDLLEGKLYSNKSHDLNSEECLAIGKHASLKHINWTILFYEAAIRKLDMYDGVILNKTQILHEVVAFYAAHGKVCQNKVSKLQNELDKSLTEINTEVDGDDTAKDDGIKEDGTEKDKGRENVNNKRKMQVKTLSDTLEKLNLVKEHEDSEDNENAIAVNANETPNNGKSGDEISHGRNDSKNIKDEDRNLSGAAEENEAIKGKDSNLNDEKCIKEIINRFSGKFSSSHDEL